MRNGKDAKTVPGSVRFKPSTRMSFNTNGSTAQAAPLCIAAARAKVRNEGRIFALNL